MKPCPTCGLECPDDVQTYHHPDDCTCGSILCKGMGPRGCIWHMTVTGSVDEARDAQMKLIRQRNEAIRKNPTAADTTI